MVRYPQEDTPPNAGADREIVYPDQGAPYLMPGVR